MINKGTVFKTVFVVWITLWLFFLIRENKKGQYAELGYMYTHGYNEKVRRLLGDGLNDLLASCVKYLPEGATYDIKGFPRFSIYEVRARYYLWPSVRTPEDPQFLIVYGGAQDAPDGYEEYFFIEGSGGVFIRKGRI